jgi:hypothetical protein
VVEEGQLGLDAPIESDSPAAGAEATLLPICLERTTAGAPAACSAFGKQRRAVPVERGDIDGSGHAAERRYSSGMPEHSAAGVAS